MSESEKDQLEREISILMHGSTKVVPLKWTRSEDASAKLLEMMPLVTLARYQKLVSGSDGTYWGCFASDGSGAKNSDRKVAIALAAKAWLESRTVS